MIATHVSTFGLVLDIIGVAMLYVFGPPAPKLLPDGSELLWIQPDEERTKNAQRHYFAAKVALVLLFLGFLLQVVANYIPAKTTSRSSPDAVVKEST